MKYNIGDILVCKVEKRPGKARKILMAEPAADAEIIEGAFQVIARDVTMNTYMVLIDSDMTGWWIGTFHTTNLNIPKNFLNKKFWDLPEQFVIRKK